MKLKVRTASRDHGYVVNTEYPELDRLSVDMRTTLTLGKIRGNLPDERAVKELAFENRACSEVSQTHDQHGAKTICYHNMTCRYLYISINRGSKKCYLTMSPDSYGNI